MYVVDLAVTKFSHPRELMPAMILCESMIMGVVKNITANTSLVLASNSSVADGVFNTNILHLMLFVCRYGLVIKKIVSACIDYMYIIACAVPRPWTDCYHKTKINFEGLFGLSMIINTPENYPPYGS